MTLPADLPELARDAVEVLAILGQPLHRDTLRSALLQTKIWAVGGEAVGEAVATLLQRGIVQAIEPRYSWERSLGESLGLPTETATLVMRDLARQGRLKALADRLEYFSSEVFDSYHLRVAFCLGDVELFQRWSQYDEPAPIYRDLCLHPFDAAWFARLPPALAYSAATQLLFEAVYTLADVRPLIAVLDTIRFEPGQALIVRGFAADHALLSGDLDRARSLSAPADMTLGAMQRACIAFVEGRPEALQGFDTALDADKKASRKRKLVLPDVHGIFHVLALYRAGRKHEAEQMAAVGLSTTHREEFRLLGLLDRVATGEAVPDSRYERAGSLELLFDALLHLWAGNVSGRLLSILEHRCEQARNSGFHWIADQYDDVIRRAGGRPARERVTSLPSLTDLVVHRPAWDRALDLLARTVPEAAPSTTRIIWLLRWENEGVINVEVREQKARGRGAGWSRGKVISGDGLLRGPQAAVASPHDQEAARAFILDRVEYRGWPRTVLALAGHPAVYWMDDPERSVEIVKAEPQLRVEVAPGDNVRLRLHPTVERGVHVERESESRLCVYAVSAKHREIAEILGRDGLLIPREGRERVLDTVAALARVVTVQSDVGASAVEPVAVDPRLYVQLTPRGEGCAVSVRVRPLGNEGPALIPGRGARAVIDRGRRQAIRDLDAESTVFAQLRLGDADGETDGLEETLALLERIRELGGAVVAEWPQGAARRVARSSPDALRLRVAAEHDWFRVEGSLTLDDGRILQLRDVLAALQAGEGRYVPLGEGEFVALERSLRKRLEQLQACADTHGKTLRVHPLAAPALEEVLRNADADQAWRDHLERLAADPAPAVPRTLDAELRDYQVEGYRWLTRLAAWGAGACLADDMGLGKTVQALALILQRVRSRKGTERATLVVAPTSVCYNWMAEATRFAPTLRPRLYAGSERAAVLARLGKGDLVVCSYAIMQQDVEALAAVAWQTVILDEAQAIKNVATRRAQAAMKLQAGFRVITTGTPIENHLGELWTLFRFLVPGLLGSAEQFQKRFAVPIERARDGEARARLRRLIGPFILRRTKSQVLEQLPPRTEIVLSVELGKEERALYEALRQRALERLQGGDERQPLQILAELMKLRRACCHPRLVLPDSTLPGAKLEAFGEVLDELLDNRHRALVFSQFTDHLALLREHLERRGTTFQYLDGATPMAERKRRVEAFQQGEGELFLISLRAGGTGLNLTAADYVIHLDPWWNPAVEDQASDRAHRIGQERPVTVYRLVAKDTIEERIVDLHRHKRELADSLLEGTDAAARMSTDELLALLREG